MTKELGVIAIGSYTRMRIKLILQVFPPNVAELGGKISFSALGVQLVLYNKPGPQVIQSPC